MIHLVCMHGTRLADGVSLDMIGTTSLAVGDGLVLRINGSLEEKTGRVIQMADHGARPVIETEGKRWWLRPVDVVHTGPVPCRSWEVGGEGDGD